MWRLKKSINLSEALLASTSTLAEQHGRRQRGVVLVQKGCGIRGWMWEGGVLGFWSQTLPVAIHYYCRCVVAVALKSKFKVAKVQFTFYPYLSAAAADICIFFKQIVLIFVHCEKFSLLFFARPLEFVVGCLFVCWLCISDVCWVIFFGEFLQFRFVFVSSGRATKFN